MLSFCRRTCSAKISVWPKSSYPFYEKLYTYVSPRVSAFNETIKMIYKKQRLKTYLAVTERPALMKHEASQLVFQSKFRKYFFNLHTLLCFEK